jgi:hypothetical protein
MKRTIFTLMAALMAAGTAPIPAQDAVHAGDAPADQLTESGNVVFGSRSLPYLIHRLPISAFPELPAQIAGLLNQRGCVIPQTYEAHRPENVVHGSLERDGSSDWAVLCSEQGTVSLLVFFASAPEHPIVLVTAPEKRRLQAQGPDKPLGFNWGIDPASPENVHEAQSSMGHRPSPPDHDALADSVIDHSTVYHFYAKGQWTLLNMPE